VQSIDTQSPSAQRKRAGLPDFSWHNVPKPGRIYVITSKIKNSNKICQMYIVCIFQMDIEYTNLFHSKTLQNLPKMGFWVWKYTIWQTWQIYVAINSKARAMHFVGRSVDEAFFTTFENELV
jgi:hypothetical protein